MLKPSIDPEKLYRATFIRQYGLCCCVIWSSFLFGSFVKIWGTCDNFLGKWSTPPPPAKNFPYAYAHATAFRVRISFTTLRDEPWTIF